MGAVLQLSKRLSSRPAATPVKRIRLRHFNAETDLEPWLRLRENAFARLRVGVRQWTSEDFRTEILDKPWWSSERMWLAESEDSEEPAELVGSVIWADRTSPAAVRPAVHWLAVAPRWRRHGIGQLLMNSLETSVWDAGYRQIWLETHAAWTAAAEFYQRLGYERV